MTLTARAPVHGTRRRSSGAARPSGDAQRAAQLWHVWPGRNQPSTADEESVFVAELRAMAGDATPSAAARSDVTAVLNALRCGLLAGELFDRAPGLVPAQLLAAYQHLDDRRRRAVVAWEAITRDRTPAVLQARGAEAAKLLPLVIHAMSKVAIDDPRRLDAAVEAEIAEIERVDHLARSLEARMARTPAGPRRHDVGRLLYDLSDPGVWAHPHFVPDRVGTLVPVRVAALLGERLV